MPYAKKDYSSDVKVMSVYTGDFFLDAKYGEKSVLVGQQTLVQEMWDPRNSIMEDLRRSQKPPSSILVEFRPPERMRVGAYDVGSIRTVLVGVRDAWIHDDGALYAPSGFAEKFYLKDRTIIIKPVIPEFGMKNVSRESLRLWR